MVFDITRRYPRAYVHRHKLHPRHPPFKAEGQSEVVMLVGMIDLLIQDGSDIDERRKISIQNPTSAARMEYTLKPVYTKAPHITADNFFLSEPMIDWLGGKGYGFTATCEHQALHSSHHC